MIFSSHIASKYAVKYAVLTLLGVLTESGGVVRFYFMANLRDLKYLFCSRERSLLLTPDQTEENIWHREYKQVTVGEKKTRCSADDCTLVFGPVQTEKETTTHGDSYLFQKYGI